MKKKIFLSLALVAFALTLGLTANLRPISSASAAEDSLVSHSQNHNHSSEYKQCYKSYKHRCNNSQKLIVTGSATTMVQPDFATVSFSIETTNKNLEVAQKENSTIMQNIKSVLSTHNLSEQDLTTNWFNIYPEYNYNYGNQTQPTGHRVSNQLSLKVREIDNIGKIIDTLTASGANMISGIQFGIEDNSNAYNEALSYAVENAKQKAIVLSNANIDDLRIVVVKEMPIGHICFER